MPYEMRESEGQWCVYQQGGPLVKCHGSEAEAKDHMAALYVNVPNAKALTVKFADASETEIEGILAPHGGSFNGRDLAGEFFSTKTDFCLDWFPSKQSSRPLLYQHGLDNDLQTSVIGRITDLEAKADVGLWMRAQLDAQHEFYGAIKELIKQGKLFLSSGSMSHLVQKNAKTGELLRWPVIEGSLTPTPCNLLATLDFATAKAHFKMIGADLPEHLASVKMGVVMAKRMMREMATEMGVEMSDDEMDAMMSKAGDMSEMDEDEAKEKMRGMLKPMAKKSIKSVSWETIRSEVGELCDQMMHTSNPFEQNGWCYVEATYSDHCIIQCHLQGQGDRYYSVPFALGEDGHVASLGKPEEAEEDWKPKQTSMSAMPMGMHAEMAKVYATSLLERTKDLRERRTKEGRVLSTGNRRKLSDCLDVMRQACDALDTLLSATEPPAKAGDVLLRSRFRLLELEAALL